MSFELEKILESKRSFRRSLAGRPIVEKLRILDALRERELAIRGGSGPATVPAVLHEKNPPYGTRPK